MTEFPGCAIAPPIVAFYLVYGLLLGNTRGHYLYHEDAWYQFFSRVVTRNNSCSIYFAIYT